MCLLVKRKKLNCIKAIQVFVVFWNFYCESTQNNWNMWISVLENCIYCIMHVFTLSKNNVSSGLLQNTVTTPPGKRALHGVLFRIWELYTHCCTFNFFLIYSVKYHKSQFNEIFNKLRSEIWHITAQSAQKVEALLMLCSMLPS